MSDDWRLKITMGSDADARALGHALGDRELEHDLERSFGERVVVSVDDAEVFCYCGTRRQAQAARQLIHGIAEREGWSPAIELARWHPTAERWEDPAEPLPADAGDAESEREQRVADERAESAQQGYPEFEVRIACRSRGEAGRLAERLDADGIPTLHRWSAVLIGATDEDAAQALADRLRSEAPASATVTVERNERGILDTLTSPFAVLGGMGG